MDDIKDALRDLARVTAEYIRQRIRRRADLIRVATMRYRAPAEWIPRAEHEQRCKALSAEAADWKSQAHQFSRALAEAQINPPKPAGYIDLSAMLNAPELSGLRAHMFAAGVRRGLGRLAKDSERR